MNRIIAILHDREDADNRCCAWLTRNGYRVDMCCPAEGDAVPVVDDSAAGVVVFGGRQDVKMKTELLFLRQELGFIEDVLARHIPLLGICLGGQLLAHVLGQDVDLHPDGHAEYGYYDLKPTAEGEEVFGSGLKVLESHWHGWYDTPAGAIRLAGTDAFPQQAFRYGNNAYALQFHPEATRQTLLRWIGRRPPERHLLKGAMPPQRQLADNLVHDEALGRWFEGFLDRWIGPARDRRDEAA